MKTTNQMPQKGQFVAIWEYENKVWSGVFVWHEDGMLRQYEPYSDTFVVSPANYEGIFENATFVTEL